jgi:pimeloyl-ACP methyl ester carboxylesterase
MHKLINTKRFSLAINIEGDPDAKKLAIALPGRCDSKDYHDMVGLVDFLSKKGFLALSFDPPGTWDSGGDTRIYSMTNYLKAVDEIIEYYDNKPTLLVGHSRGGSIAIIAGTRNPHVNAFVAIMGRYSYKTEVKKLVDHNDDLKTKGFFMEYRDLPPGGVEKVKAFKIYNSFVIDSSQYDASDDLKKCTKPKMFIAGEKDITIKPETVKEEYDISHSPKEYRTIPWDHDYRRSPENIGLVNKLIEEFIIKYKL